MNKQKNTILLEINEELCLKDKLLLFLFKRYTYRIYEIGYKNGFKWRS